MSGDFCDTRLVVAAKAHKCEECSRTITPLETYQRAAGKWEGDFWFMVSCAHCAAFREIILDFDDWFWEGCYGGISNWAWDTCSDVIYDRSRLPWEERMYLFRLRRLFCNDWQDSAGNLAPIPDPRRFVEQDRNTWARRQILDRFFPGELPGQTSIYDVLEGDHATA